MAGGMIISLSTAIMPYPNHLVLLARPSLTGRMFSHNYNHLTLVIQRFKLHPAIRTKFQGLTHTWSLLNILSYNNKQIIERYVSSGTTQWVFHLGASITLGYFTLNISSTLVDNIYMKLHKHLGFHGPKCTHVFKCL